MPARKKKQPDLQAEIDSASAEILRLNSIDREGSPEHEFAKVLQQSKLTSLLSLQALQAGDTKLAAAYDKAHCDWEQRRSAAEKLRQGDRQIEIIQRLDAMDAAGDTLATMEGDQPEYDPDDE